MQKNKRASKNVTEYTYRSNEKIKDLTALADAHDAKGIKFKLQEIVPEYTMSDDEAVL